MIPTVHQLLFNVPLKIPPHHDIKLSKLRQVERLQLHLTLISPARFPGSTAINRRESTASEESELGLARESRLPKIYSCSPREIRPKIARDEQKSCQKIFNLPHLPGKPHFSIWLRRNACHRRRTRISIKTEACADWLSHLQGETSEV